MFVCDLTIAFTFVLGLDDKEYSRDMQFSAEGGYQVLETNMHAKNQGNYSWFMWNNRTSVRN